MKIKSYIDVITSTSAMLIATVSVVLLSGQSFASSHMDAPLITFDDAANTTDVYAFLSSRNGEKYLTTALVVYPFENPGIGPNKHTFDDNVLYEIYVVIGDDLAAGNATFSYQFRFETAYKTQGAILQSYLGVILDVDDASQNLTQTYNVTKVIQSSGDSMVFGLVWFHPIIKELLHHSITRMMTVKCRKKME